METRIYLQLVPDEATRTRLHAICAELKAHISGIAVDPAKWHVTILHFGGAEHVFHDIRRELPTLGKKFFEENLHTYLEKAQSSLPQPMTLQPTGIEIFGINRSVLGLAFTPNDALAASHERAIEDLKVFLSSCGIQNPEAFMRSSINFRWALNLRPHITLFRGIKSTYFQDIPIDTTPMQFGGGEIHGL